MTVGALKMAVVTNHSFSKREYVERHERLGALLRESMLRHGVGVTELCRQLGIPRNHFYQIARGARPLYAEHLIALPEGVRQDMFRELLGRVGETVAKRLPADDGGLREALRELTQTALEGASLAHQLAGKRFATAEVAEQVISIGERGMRACASLIEWGKALKRERVVGLEDE